MRNSGFDLVNSELVIYYDEAIEEPNNLEGSAITLTIDEAKELQVYLNDKLGIYIEQEKMKGRLAQLRRKKELEKELEGLDKQLKVE